MRPKGKFWSIEFDVVHYETYQDVLVAMIKKNVGLWVTDLNGNLNHKTPSRV